MTVIRKLIDQLRARRQRVALLVLLAIVLAAKWPVLSTPYYWDEKLWIRFAHALQQKPLWSFLPGIAAPAEFGGRPPGLYVTMAVLLKATGASIAVSHLLIVGFSFLGVYFTFLLGDFLYGWKVGIFAALSLFLNAIYFAQSAMFLSDLPVSAIGVMTVYFALRRQYYAYLMCGLYLVTLKETAMAIIFSVAVYTYLMTWPHSRRLALRHGLAYSVPLLMIMAYYAWQKVATGQVFVNYSYEFQPFQPTEIFSMRKIALVSDWLFVKQYRWIFAIAAAVHLVIRRPAFRLKEHVLFGLLFLSSGYSFCCLYFLPRYLLPVAPYFFLLGAWSLFGVVKSSRLCAVGAASVLAIFISCLPGLHLYGNCEWNMRYRDIALQQEAMCRYIEREFADARIATIWPLSDYLSQPQLGYVSQRLDAVRVLRFDELTPGDADLFLYADQAEGSRRKLREFAARENLELQKRFGSGQFRCELYLPQGAGEERGSPHASGRLSAAITKSER